MEPGLVRVVGPLLQVLGIVTVSGTNGVVVADGAAALQNCAQKLLPVNCVLHCHAYVQIVKGATLVSIRMVEYCEPVVSTTRTPSTFAR